MVWVVLDSTREVLVIGSDGARLPPHPALPGLEPEVADFFEQLD